MCSPNEHAESQADTCIDKQQRGKQIGKKVQNQYIWESKFWYHVKLPIAKSLKIGNMITTYIKLWWLKHTWCVLQVWEWIIMALWEGV